MRTTAAPRPRFDPLAPRGAWAFAALTALWAARWVWPDFGYETVRGVSWLCGYLALACLLVPYLHIARRAIPARPGRMTRWLRGHVACSYAAFLLVLLHSQGRGGSPLTFSLLALLWLVMLLGVVGLYGQKVLYAWLPALGRLRREYGRERLEPQRAALEAEATKLIEKNPFRDAAEFVQALAEHLMAAYMLPVFDWRSARPDETDQTRYDWAALLATDAQRKPLADLWALTRERLELDREHRLHVAGRLWLLVHGPAAWALLVLVAEHVLVSLRYAGWWY